MEIGYTTTHPINDLSQVSEIRRHTNDFAFAAKFNAVQAGRLAIVATELGSNIIKHADKGTIVISLNASDGSRCVDILSLDKGPGMSDLEECFRDGYSTYGSAGTGLGAIERQSDEFDIYTLPANGTAIWSRIYSDKSKMAIGKYDIAGISIRMPGEEVCGDMWDARAERTSTYLITCDGLGHGIFAESASKEAIRLFNERPGANVLQIIQELHSGLRGTRGVAGAIAMIEEEKESIQYVGIGNISAVINSLAKSRQLISHNGTLGHNVNKFQSYSYPFTSDDVLVMHSDGLQTRWLLESYPGLRRRRSKIIAGILYRDFSRGRDDATVVVLKKRLAV